MLFIKVCHLLKSFLLKAPSNRPNLDASTFVVDDSQMRSWTADMEQFVWRQSLVAQVYVNHMPDLNEEADRIKLLEYISRLERLPNAVGVFHASFLLHIYALNRPNINAYLVS